ncbi:MAG: mevalonate kinase family protein [Candidatus Heimdallarchaeaceae archaeon]
MRKIRVSAPGRICLFGEDVDYLGLNTITIAIDKRIEIEGEINTSGEIEAKLEDIGEKICFKNKKQQPLRKREYIKSVFNLFHQHLSENFGAKLTISATLPIGKGLSSSSAYCTALVGFFSRAAKQKLSVNEIAQLAYSAEVLSFNEPGGMMDHFASAVGDVIYLHCKEPYHYHKLLVKLEGLVIGDTLETKKTIEAISRRKSEILQGVKIMKSIDSNFDLNTYPLEKLERYFIKQPSIGIKRLIGALGIRDVVREGYKVLTQNEVDYKRLAQLINLHHNYQKTCFENVTNKMDFLIQEAMKAGAKACKLLGSGNGGCFLAIAAGNEEEIIKAIEDNGGIGYIVKQDNGVKIEEY